MPIGTYEISCTIPEALTQIKLILGQETKYPNKETWKPKLNFKILLLICERNIIIKEIDNGLFTQYDSYARFFAQFNSLTKILKVAMRLEGSSELIGKSKRTVVYENCIV